MQKKTYKHSPTVDWHRADQQKLTISNSISNSIINSSKAKTALPTASNSIPNSDSTTATQRLKQLTGCLLTILHPIYRKKKSARGNKNQQRSAQGNNKSASKRREIMEKVSSRQQISKQAP